MNCIACRLEVNNTELLKCKACRRIYHHACVNMTTAHYMQNKTSLLNTWKCPACINVTRRNNKDNTPVRQVHAPSLDMSCDEEPSQEVANTTQHSQSAPITYDQINGLFESFRVSLANDIRVTIKSEINTAIENLKSEFTATTDFLSSEQCDLRKELNVAKTTIKDLESENLKMSSEMRNLERRLVSLEKSSRSQNLEIQCVPENKAENLFEIVNKLGKEINVSITDAEVKSTRRVSKLEKSAERPRNILVTLSSERQRDTILTAFKAYNREHRATPLTSTHLGVPGAPTRVYVAEHLAPECKHLFALARKAARELNYKHVWAKYGRVFVKKDDKETSGTIYIKDATVLKEL